VDTPRGFRDAKGGGLTAPAADFDSEAHAYRRGGDPSLHPPPAGNPLLIRMRALNKRSPIRESI